MPLPDGPTDPLEVIEPLARDAEPGLTEMASGRYFGFVIGGALPVDARGRLADARSGIRTPASRCRPRPRPSSRRSRARWLKELLGIPAHASFALVTGCQMAHWTALAAARHHVLARSATTSRRDGLAGRAADPRDRRRQAPRHDRPRAPLPRPRHRLDPARAGRRRRAAWSPTRCARSSRASGADDRLRAVRRGEHRLVRRPRARSPTRVEGTGAWLHVDGAFGLWAAASPSLRHLTAGVERADSWATDAHKWLNVPYDSGVAFCAHPESHRAALGIRSVYLIHSDDARRDPVDWTPEHSRRARALHDLRRAAVARPLRASPSSSSRPACARARSRAGLARRSRLRDPERRRAQPGAPPLRGRRRDRPCDRGDPGGRRGLARRHGLGRPARDPDLGLELADERGRRRAHGRGVPGTPGLRSRPDERDDRNTCPCARK